MKKMLSRVISIMMCLVLLAGALPMEALAAPQIVSNTVDINVEAQQAEPDAGEPAVTFTVRFVGFGGAELKSVAVPQGGSVATAEWPSAAQDGYAFLGWDDGAGTVSALENVQQDITLTAQYVQLFTITYENWDGTLLADVANVLAGTRFVAADHYDGSEANPTREGFGFTAWEPAVIESVSGNSTVTAVFAPLIQRTITINYIFENQHQAHDPYVATVYDGYPFNEVVPSPAIMGYTPDQPAVTIEGDIRSDVSILVTYSSNLDTQYRIVHMLQDVTGDGYTVAATDIRTGRTGSLTQVTAADVKTTYTGFVSVTSIETCNDYIAADGSTMIALKYDRVIHFVMFDTADGTYIAPQVGRYGTPVTAPATPPTRPGYTFKSWNITIPTTIGIADVTVTAQWTAKTDTPYTVVYLMQDPNDTTQYTFAGSEAYAGTTGTLVSANKSWTDKTSWWKSTNRIPDTQDEFYKRDGFAYLDNDAAIKTIMADGSTVVYVRFKRNDYSVTFYTKTGNKWNSVYVITAPYGATIADRWITIAKPGQYTDYTWNISSTSSVFIGFVQNMPINGYNLYGSVKTGYDFAIIYMTECAEGQTPTTTFGGHSYRQSGITVAFKYNSTGIYLTSEDMSDFIIKGFRYYGVRTGSTNYVDTEPSNATFTYNSTTKRYEVFVFFNRLSYTITYHNGSATSTTDAIPYASDISGFNTDISGQRPANIPADYLFDGWYSDSGCTVRFDGWDDGMPANNLTVYASWKKPSYQVTFNLNYEGAGVYATQTVLKNATATTVASPTRDGYQFDYWYYEDGGTERIFTFSMGITANLSLRAHWTAVNVTYTVRYVDGNGNAVRDAAGKTLAVKTGQGKVSALITETAPAAFNSSNQPLFPDRASSSITLKASSAQNVITFTYTRVPTVYYIVRFVDTDGAEKAPAKGPFATSDVTVTAQYVNINGYSPNAYQITRNLAAETDPGNITQNIITFVYTKNPTGVYIVKRYLQNLNDNAYVCDESATETITNAPLGSTAYAPSKEYDGYSFVAGISTVSGVVYSSVNNPLTLRVYYNRNLMDYSASFVDTDTGETVAPDATGKARFGKSVTVYASAIAGYQLDETQSAASAAIAITSNAAANHVTFYYKVRGDIAVNIRFLDEAGNNIATPVIRTGSDPAVRLGRAYTYTLSAGQMTLSHNEELFDLADGTPTAQTVTIAQGDNYIDYRYIPRKYTLAFDANGGTGAPESQRHRYRDVFPLPSQRPAYGEYRFEGWSENPAVLGKVYQTQAELGTVQLISSPFTMPNADVTLYAVWSHIEVTLSYASDAPYTGSLPSAVTVPVGDSVTVTGAGSMVRTGYVFTGWKRKNDAGQLVNPPYGPDAAWEHSISITVNTVLYASWTPRSYTVTWQHNLPAQAAARFINPNAATVSYTVESAPITIMDAACYGYTFLGWYTDAGFGTPATGIPTGSTGNRTFYARFTPAPLDGLTLQGYTGVYDGQAHGVTLSDSKDQLRNDIDTVVYSPTNSNTNVTGSPAAVTVTVWRDGVAIWTGSATVSITPKPIALSADNIDGRYDGTAHALIVYVPAGENGAVNSADELAILGSLTYTVGGQAVSGSFADAMDTTTVTVSAQHPNYLITPAYPTVTIGRRPVIITADSLTVTYDAQPHRVTTWQVAPADETGGLVGTDAVDTVSLSDNERMDAGVSHPTPHGATLVSGKADNYLFQYESGVLTVEQSANLTLDLSAGAGTYVYDALAHGFTPDAHGVPVTLEYHMPGEDWQPLAEGAALPSFTDVGEYTLFVRASSPNYANKAVAKATLTITAREVTLRAGSLSEAYDGLEHVMNTWSVDPATATSGLLGADAIQSVTLTDNTRTVPGSNAVGIAVAAWREGSNPENYTMRTVDGLIEVTANAGALAIAVDDETRVYDGVGHHLNYTVTAPEGCPYDVSYSLNGGAWVQLAAGEALPDYADAGTYAFALRVESTYYQVAGEDSSTLTITRRPVTLIAGEAYGNIYNGTSYTVGYTVSDMAADSGLLEIHTVQALLVGASQTDAGTYTVTFDPARTLIRQSAADVTANYAIGYTDGVLEIVKATSGTADETAAAVYDGQPHGFTLPALRDADESPVSGATIAYSETPLAADDAGWITAALPTYTPVKALAADGQPEAYRLYVRLTHPNYETQIAQTSLTIEPAAVTLTADSRLDFPYTMLGDGTAKVWRIDYAHWQIDGLAADTLYAGDTISYVLANNTQSAVDDGHPVTFASYGVAEAANSKNYRIQTVDGFIRVVRGEAPSLLSAAGFSTTYDAQAHSLAQPTVSVAATDDSQVERTDDFALSYSVTLGDTEQTYSALPSFTEAGTYAVRISASSDLHTAPEPVTVEVVIGKRALTVSSAVETVAYDGAQHSAALYLQANGLVPDTDHAVAQSALALASGGQNTATLAGAYGFAIDPVSVRVFSGALDVTANYAVYTVAGSLTITPAQVAAADIAMADVDTVYDGQPYSLTPPQTMALGAQTIDLTDSDRFTFAYRALDTLTAGAVEGAVSGNPAYVNASAHRVTLQITDSTGSLLFAPVSALVTVRRRSVTITANSGTFPYDGEAHTVTGHDNPTANDAGEGFVDGDYASLMLTGNTRTAAGSNIVGLVYPTALAQGDLNNYDLRLVNGTITVTKAVTLPLTLTADSGVYNGGPRGFIYTVGEPDTAALSLAYSTDGVLWTPFTTAEALPAYTAAGSYPLYLRAASTNFEAEAQADAILVIAARPVEVTPIGDTFVYDGTAKALTRYDVERAVMGEGSAALGGSGLVGNDGITVTLTDNERVTVGVTDVGSANAQPTGDTVLGNYDFQYRTGKLTVTPRSGLSVTLTANSGTYDGLAHGFDFASNALGETTYFYRVDGGPEMTFTQAGDLPALTDVGAVQLTVRAVNPNYDADAESSDTVYVYQALLTLQVQSAIYPFDGQPHSLTATPEGLVGGDELTAYTLSPAEETETGVYAVTVAADSVTVENTLRGGNLIGNYTLTIQPGVLSIAGFTLTGYRGTYDGEAHGVAVLVPDVFAAHYDLTYTSEGATGAATPSWVDAGTYPVTVTLTPKDAASGLPVLQQTVNVQIDPKPVALQATDINKVYNGLYSEIDISLPGGAAVNAADEADILASVTLSVGGAPVANGFVDTGSLSVTVAGSHPNYEIAPAAASVQIARRPVTVTAGTDEKPYDEQPLTVAYTTQAAVYTGEQVSNESGLLREHTLTAILLDASQTDVCDQLPVTFDTAATQIDGAAGSVLGNYDVRYVDGAITITRAASLTLSLAGYDAVYDAATHGVRIVSILDGTRVVAVDRFDWVYGLSPESLTATAYTATDVSDALVYVRGVSVDGNYPDIASAARVRITPRPVRVTPATEEYTYDGTTRTVTDYTLERATLNDAGQPADTRGLLGADTLTVSLTNASHAVPGVYNLGWDAPQMTVGQLANYSLESGSGTLTILPASAGLWIRMDADSVPYDAQAHRLAYEVTAPEGCPYVVEYAMGDSQTYTVVGADGLLPAMVQAGTYPFRVRVTSEYFIDGYAAGAANTLTIGLRPLAIEGEIASFPYNKAEHSVNALYSITPSTAFAGLVDAGETVHSIATFDYEAGKDNLQTDVGGHEVSISVTSLAITDQTGADVTANYDISLTSGHIEVLPQATSALDTSRSVPYDSQPQGFTLPVLLDAAGEPVTESVTYRYSVNGVDFSDTPIAYTDVAAGGYSITIRAMSPNYQPADVIATLAITPAPITVAADTRDDFIYTIGADGAAIEWRVTGAQLTQGTLYRGETLSYTLGDASRSDIGEQVVTLDSCAVVLGALDVSANYAITLQNGHLTVNQGTASAQMTTQNNGGVYNGEAYTLPQPIVSVMADDGTYVDQTADYSIRYVATRASDGDTETFVNELPRFVNVGVYQIEITATSRRHASPVTGSATLTVTPRPLVVTSGDNALEPYTYSGSLQMVDAWRVVTGTFAPDESITAYTFADGLGNEATDICDRAVTLTAVTVKNGTKTLTANYEITYVPGRIVILPLTVGSALALTGADHVYDGGQHTIAVSDTLATPVGNLSLSGATLPDGSPRFTLAYAATPYGGTAGASTAVKPMFTDVALETVTVYVTDLTGNLIIMPASETVEVTKRDVTVTPESLSVPYDGNGHSVTSTLRPKAELDANGIAIGDTGLVGSDDVAVTLVGNGPYTDVGTYPVTWVDPARMTSGNLNNYTFLHAEGSLAITPATGIDLSLAAHSATYDGQAHGFTATALVPAGCAYTLAYQNASGEWVTVAEGSPLPTYVDAGEYPLTVRIQSPNYADSMERTAILTIAPRPLAVASGDNSAEPFTYDREAHSVAAAFVSEGTLAEGDALSLASAVFETGLGNENTDVCNRPVSLAAIAVLGADGRDVTANYDLRYVRGAIVILPAAARTEPVTTDADYDGQPHSFARPQMTDTLGRAVEGAEIAYSLVALNAGDAGWLPIDNMPARTDVARDASGNVASYILYVRLSHSNYQPVVTTATLTIAPAPVTITADTNDSFVYTLDGDGNPFTWHVNTATLSGTLYNGETPVYTLTDNAQATIGGHAVYVDTVRLMFGGTDYTSNYTITRMPGHIAVSRGTAATVIAAADASAVYDALAHRIAAPAVLVDTMEGHAVDRTADFALTYAVTRADTGETWSFDDLADMAFTEAAAYTVTIRAESELYAAPADATVTLTITRRPLSVTSENNSESSGGTPYTYNGAEQSVRGDAVVVNLVDGHTLTDLAYAPDQSNANVLACDRDVLLTGVTVMSGRADVTANYQIAYHPGHIVIKPFAITSAQIELISVNTEYDGFGHSIGLPQTIRTDIGEITIGERFDVVFDPSGETNPLQSAGNTGFSALAAGRESDEESAGIAPPVFYDVGVHPVTVMLVSRDGCFTVEPATATVTITPRDLTVRYGTLSERYTGELYIVPRQIEGLVARDAITLTEANRSAVNVTRLPDGTPGALISTSTSLLLTAATDPSIDRSGNYSVTVVDGSIEILPLALTIRVADYTFPYDATEHTVTEATGDGLLADHALRVTLGNNRATNVVAGQQMELLGQQVTNPATGEDVTGNYTVRGDIGKLSVTAAPLKLQVTSLTLTYDGLYHQPDVYASSGLMGADYLAAATLVDMPQRQIGEYRNVTVDMGSVVLANAGGADVTANYDISVVKGRLVIQAPTAAYTVRYYYDDVLSAGATQQLSGVLGSTVSTYPPRLLPGYALSRATNLPLILSKNADENVIRVYYVSVPRLISLDDLAIPLGAGGLSYEMGLAVE